MRQEELLQVVQETHEQRVAGIDEHYRRERWYILLTFALLLGLVIVLEWLDNRNPPPPGRQMVEIQNLRATGPTDLCPGETLGYRFDVHGEQRGVLEFDMSVWRLEPPGTVIFSQPIRIVLIEPVHYPRSGDWLLPVELADPLTGAPVAWSAGHYEWRIAYSTASRSTTPTIAALPFTIREDCPD